MCKIREIINNSAGSDYAQISYILWSRDA